MRFITVLLVQFVAILAFAAPKGQIPLNLDLLQEGDVIFYQGFSNQVDAIKEFSGSPWSHVGLLFKEKGQWMVWEAIEPVGINPIDHFLRRAKGYHDGKPVVAVYRLDLKQVKMDQESYSACLNDVKERLRPHFGKHYNRMFTWQTDTMYCSQFVWDGLQACGVDLGELEETTGGNLGKKVLALYASRARAIQGKDMDDKRLLAAFKKAYGGQKIITPVSILRDPKLNCVTGCQFTR